MTTKKSRMAKFAEDKPVDLEETNLDLEEKVEKDLSVSMRELTVIEKGEEEDGPSLPKKRKYNRTKASRRKRKISSSSSSCSSSLATPPSSSPTELPKPIPKKGRVGDGGKKRTARSRKKSLTEASRKNNSGDAVKPKKKTKQGGRVRGKGNETSEPDSRASLSVDEEEEEGQEVKRETARGEVSSRKLRLGELGEYPGYQPWRRINIYTSDDKESPSKIPLPRKFRDEYTKEERERLYADKRFVMDLHDMDKKMKIQNICIWQIHRDENYLRQYYPTKCNTDQYFMLSPVRWYFFKEDFESEEFYTRFQPIPVVVAFVKDVFPEIDNKEHPKAMKESLVQFVHSNRHFFNRTAKVMGHIDNYENLRLPFINMLNALAYESLYPETIAKAHELSIEETKKEFKQFFVDLKVIRGTMDMVLAKISESWDVTEEAVAQVQLFPNMTTTTNYLPKSGHLQCQACRGKKRNAYFKVGFLGQQYDYETLLASKEVAEVPQNVYWCRPCSVAAQKYQRFYHFIHYLSNVVKKKVDGFKKFVRESVERKVTELELVTMMAVDLHWINLMFLEFQVCISEQKVEFFSKGG